MKRKHSSKRGRTTLKDMDIDSMSPLDRLKFGYRGKLDKTERKVKAKRPPKTTILKKEKITLNDLSHIKIHIDKNTEKKLDILAMIHLEKSTPIFVSKLFRIFVADLFKKFKSEYEKSLKKAPRGGLGAKCRTNKINKN